MLKNRYALALVGLLFFKGGAEARPPKLPPVSSTALNGTWEFLDPEALRFCVLRVGGSKPSDTRFVMLSGPIPVEYSFLGTSVSVGGGGKVTIEGVGKQNGVLVHLKLEGTGVAFGSEGRLEANVAFKSENSTIEDHWPLVLIKGETSLPEWLTRAQNRAKFLLDANAKR